MNKIWRDLENAFASDVIKVKNRKPNIDKLFNQEEHLIYTNKGNIHIMCHLEMFENEVTPVITIQTTLRDALVNFMENRGPQIVQLLSHRMKKEYNRLLDGSND